MTRREVWLSIALAVAQDKLPEPQTVNFINSEIVSLYLDTADDARAWADWIDAENSGRWTTHENGSRSVHYHGSRYGWDWQISAFRLPAVTLEQQVAAAILQPDSPLVGAP